MDWAGAASALVAVTAPRTRGRVAAIAVLRLMPRLRIEDMKLSRSLTFADDVTVLRAGKTVATFAARVDDGYTPEEAPPRGRPYDESIWAD